jgi:hypothetical protein
MCRCGLGGGYLASLECEEKDFIKNEAKKKKIRFKCAGCLIEEIPNNIHKCILCTSYELCSACYMANKHIKHPFIKQVENPSGKWCGGE